jgi:hypothetical protein
MNTEYDVWLGLDVGKTDHHGCGLVGLLKVWLTSRLDKFQEG